MTAPISYSDKIDSYTALARKAHRSFTAKIEPSIRVHYDDIPADIRDAVIAEFDAGNNHIVIERTFSVAFDIDDECASDPILLTTQFGYDREIDAFIAMSIVDWLETDGSRDELSDVAYNNGWLSVRSMKEEHGTW